MVGAVWLTCGQRPGGEAAIKIQRGGRGEDAEIAAGEESLRPPRLLRERRVGVFRAFGRYLSDLSCPSSSLRTPVGGLGSATAAMSVRLGSVVEARSQLRLTA